MNRRPEGNRISSAPPRTGRTTLDKDAFSPDLT